MIHPTVTIIYCEVVVRSLQFTQDIPVNNYKNYPLVICYIWKIIIEIIDLPMINGGSFQFAMYVKLPQDGAPPIALVGLYSY